MSVNMKCKGAGRKLFWVAAVVLALVIACAAYVSDYYHADDAAVMAMAGSETVAVQEQAGMTVFLPEEPEAGLIFYPGGKVAYTAYAPLMLALAERGVLCVLVEMPCNLAVLDVNAAEGVPEQFPEVGRWYIGGHSLGGSMAASYAAEHAAELEGLVLLAAYSTADLTGTGLEVISLCGSADGVLNREKYETYRVNLPETAAEIIIEGGNHAGFGSYGPQEGDGEGTLTPGEQSRITAELLADFFGA